MTSLSVCPSHQLSNHHTITMACLSVCQSNHSYVCHTTTLTSLSVCHTVILTSPSVRQLQDSSVCQPTHDVIRTPICLTVCLSSVTSILPSANSMVKMHMRIPVGKFPHALTLEKLPSVHTSMESSVHHSDSPSINSSPSAANLLKFPCNYEEKNMVNYMHENLVKSPSVHTLCITSVVAPIHALSIQPVCTLCITVIAPIHASPNPSIHPSDNEHQESPDEFPSTKYGEFNLSESTVKFPHDVTLPLHQVKFLEENP